MSCDKRIYKGVEIAMRDFLIKPYYEILSKTKLPKKVREEVKVIGEFNGCLIIETTTKYSSNYFSKKSFGLLGFYLYDANSNNFESIANLSRDDYNKFVDLVLPTDSDKKRLIDVNHEYLMLLTDPSDELRYYALERAAMSAMHDMFCFNDFIYSFNADEIIQHYLKVFPNYDNFVGLFFNINNLPEDPLRNTPFIDEYPEAERLKLLEYCLVNDPYLVPACIDFYSTECLILDKELDDIVNNNPILYNYAYVSNTRLSSIGGDISKVTFKKEKMVELTKEYSRYYDMIMNYP